MQLIRRRAYARAGLIGNPSDGYGGKTISLIVRNFRAEVVLYDWPEIEVMWSQEDRSRFGSVEELVRDVELHGYYGGVRLVKATIKKFVKYCQAQNEKLHERTFSVRYQSNIPRQVGLAGSSAIIVATLRCLMDFYGVKIPIDVQPSLALSVENDELGIAAGLQDRVIQVYEGVVAMDFGEEAKSEIAGFRCGGYERVDPMKLPPLYIAYDPNVSEPGEVFHNNLRARFDLGEPQVVDAMRRFAALTDEAREALDAGDIASFGKLLDENYDLRASVCKLPKAHANMIEKAREAGASAKFAGSGGAIIGVCAGDEMFARLKEKMKQLSCRVIRPKVV